jgi:protein-S-isoprenylcysteine O-methyltransferase Ste14
MQWQAALFVGVGLVSIGHALRFWAVRHIGVISRSRCDRTGPLIVSGPYQLVRNPLYIGNWCLWTGLVLCARLPWMLPIAWSAFALQYGAIVAWEEQILLKRFPAYRNYSEWVPRWVPRVTTVRGTDARHTHPWTMVLFSERGTLLAVAIMLLGILAKNL